MMTRLDIPSDQAQLITNLIQPRCIGGLLAFRMKDITDIYSLVPETVMQQAEDTIARISAFVSYTDQCMNMRTVIDDPVL